MSNWKDLENVKQKQKKNKKKVFWTIERIINEKELNAFDWLDGQTIDM